MNDFHRDPGFADALASGELSRRELIQRGTALGIGAAGIGGMLVAAGKADASDVRGIQRALDSAQDPAPSAHRLMPKCRPIPSCNRFVCRHVV